MALTPVRVQLEGSPAFEAMADRDHTWNGFLRPRFSLDQVRKLAEWTQARLIDDARFTNDGVYVIDAPRLILGNEDTPARTETASIVVMVGWDFHHTVNPRPSGWTDVVDPDTDGLYDIGGGSWAWSEAPEPETIPIEELTDDAGRNVLSNGEVITFGAAGKTVKGDQVDYYSLSLSMESDEAAELISDLPVALICTMDMEMGLVSLDMADRGTYQHSGWNIADAFCRLGILPPATEIYLSAPEDGLSLSPERQRYILDALARSHQLHAENMARRAKDLEDIRRTIPAA
ncbi:hypothetical protein [Streptomyces sp. NPDC004528]|uniref:hypothetical protein n=1 Tax=Streptomyces sp. NPDC004528 TaxID=3154550 RepID=UPI0033B96705